MFLLGFIFTLNLIETNGLLNCPTGDCKVCYKHEDCKFIELCASDTPGAPLEMNSG